MGVSSLLYRPFCSFLPTLFRVHPAGEGEKLKQDKWQLINAQCPQGQGSFHWLILTDGKSENNFNWLAVNMPTAHILSGGYREEAWNYYEFRCDCEWAANDERSRVCAAHMCEYYIFLSVSSCLPCHMSEELLRDCSVQSERSIFLQHRVWLIFLIVYKDAYANLATCPHSNICKWSEWWIHTAMLKTGSDGWIQTAWLSPVH